MKVRIIQCNLGVANQKTWELTFLEGKLSRVSTQTLLDVCDIGSKEEGAVFKLALVDEED